MDESWKFRRTRRDDRARAVAGVMLVFLALLVGAIVTVVILNSNAPSPLWIGSVDSPTAETPAASPRALQGNGTLAPLTAAPLTDPSPAPSVRITPAPDPTADPPAGSATPPTPPEIPTDATLDAALARCPTAAEISLVDSRLRLTFVDDPTAPQLVCRKRDGSADLTRLQERAYQAVLSMRRIKFDEPLPWTNRSMLGWFRRAVTGIQFAEVTYSYCCTRDRDIVIRSQTDMSYLSGNHWVGRDELRHGLSSLVGLLAHEARHAEGYPHTCGTTEDESTGYIDDQTLEEMGAWGVNYWYLVWLSEYTDDAYMAPDDAPVDLYREEARQAAEGISNHRICDNYE